MKEKLKNVSKDTLKILGIAVIIAALLATMPYCKGILSNSNYYLVTDKLTAEQIITFDKNSRILVEFKCNGSDFTNLLSEFVKSHQNLRLECIETLHSETPKHADGFLVTFFRK